MGPGCEKVTYKDGVVTGTWRDGRIGTFRAGAPGVTVRAADGSVLPLARGGWSHFG